MVIMVTKKLSCTVPDFIIKSKGINMWWLFKYIKESTSHGNISEMLYIYLGFRIYLYFKYRNFRVWKGELLILNEMFSNIYLSRQYDKCLFYFTRHPA